VLTDWVPTIPASVAAEEVDGDLVLYNAAIPRLVALNPSAAAIWMHCDGTTTVAQLVDELAGRLGVASELMERDVERLLAELKTSGFVT
jgi:coenzyme PQQ synthesis protein D (PqqD)